MSVRAEFRAETSNVEISFKKNVAKARLVPAEKRKSRERREDKDKFGLYERKCVVVLCSVTIALEGINLSMAGPFFPEKAEQKGSFVAIVHKT